MRLHDWFVPPRPEADPRVTLGWVRRWEVIAGVASIALGFAFWNEGWWHWLLIGIGLTAVSPFGGAATILRKADRDPSVLTLDPAERRSRARTVALLQIPFNAVFGAVAGYVLDGWGFALFMAVFLGAIAAAYAWWARRRA
jgi:hypothetical protein